MPIDHTGDPLSKATCTGGPDGAEPPSVAAAAEPRRRPSTLVLMLGGVAAALVLGVLFGLWARPELIGSRPTPSAMAPVVAAPTGASQVPLVVAPPAKTESPPRAPGRLETLPPEMAAAARTQVLPSDAGAFAPDEPPAASAGESTVAEAAESPPSPHYAASFDCATARPGAEEMVCEDPALAAADRRMARAYERAMRSGADPDDLRQEQRDWTAIREDAAMHSRRALAEVYDQRIDDLNRIAEAAPNAPRDGE